MVRKMSRRRKRKSRKGSSGEERSIRSMTIEDVVSMYMKRIESIKKVKMEIVHCILAIKVISDLTNGGIVIDELGEVFYDGGVLRVMLHDKVRDFIDGKINIKDFLI